MPLQQRRFSPNHHDAIVRLIKKKMAPLQRSKKAHPNVHNKLQKQQTKNQSSLGYKIANRVSLPCLLSSSKVPAAKQKELKENNILERAREHLCRNKNSHRTADMRVQLKEYLQIFKRADAQMDTVVKQSISTSISQYQSSQKVRPKIIALNQPDLSDEEMSMLNARFRTKLNHKKMIQIFRR